MKKEFRPLSSACTALLIFSALAAGQQLGLPLPQPKHEIEVRLILVDVIATKGGEFFPGLRKEDFRLSEDGREVAINSFELVSLGTSAAETKTDPGKPPGAPAAAQRTRLTVLFDGINAWDREFKKAADEIGDELASLAESGVEIMVLALDKVRGLRIVQRFTDEEALLRAAAAKSISAAFSPSLELLDYDSLLLTMRAIDDPGMADAGEMEKLRAAVATLRTFEHLNIAKDDFTRTVGGLLAAFHLLEDLPGRKNLLFVSNGMADLDTTKINSQYPLLGRIGILDPFGILKASVFETGDEVLREIVRVANDRNVSIYAIDPGVFSRNVQAGASAEFFDREGAESQKTLLTEKYRQLQNLRMMAEKTGAVLLRGSNKIEAFRQVVRNDLSHYYRLSYYPPRNRDERAYHKIDVRLPGKRGIQVRFREGYSDEPAEAFRRLVLAKAMSDPERFLGRLSLRAEFVPFALDSETYRPWIHIAVSGRDLLGGGAPPGKKTYELHFSIKESDGADKDLLGRVTIPIDPAAFADRPPGADVLRFHFVGPGVANPKGEFKVVLGFFDPAMGDIGTWTSTFPAPPAGSRREVSFMSCVLGTAAPAGDDRKSANPSLNLGDGALDWGEITFRPKITGPFEKAENVHLFLQAFFPQGAPEEAAFDLIGKDGVSRHVPGEKIAASWNERGRIWSAAFRLDLEGVDPGDYRIRTTLARPDGTRISREMPITIF